MLNDFRFALRSLRKSPSVTAVAVVTLALGVGATTTLFTIVNAVRRRPLPYPHADRIVSISEEQDGKDGQVVAVPDFFEWARSRRHDPGGAPGVLSPGAPCHHGRSSGGAAGGVI